MNNSISLFLADSFTIINLAINVLNFAECRSQEIMTLMNEISRQGGKFSIQRLPFHMRRRAASHNPKRLPRNLRAQVKLFFFLIIN